MDPARVIDGLIALTLHHKLLVSVISKVEMRRLCGRWSLQMFLWNSQTQVMDQYWIFTMLNFNVNYDDNTYDDDT